MQRSSSFRRSDFLPSYTPSRPRSNSLVGRMASACISTVASAFVKGSPITGSTPAATIKELAEEMRFGYKIQGQDTYVLEKQLRSSTEGSINLMKAQSTGNLYIAKHTFAVKHKGNEFNQRDPAFDDDTYKFPNESKILQHKMYAHRHIIGILETTRDRVEAGRYRIWMEYCSGGDLYTQCDFWRVKHCSGVPEVFLLHTIVQGADALAFLHHGLRYDRGGKYTQDENHYAIVHGDIKDENVFLRHTDNAIGGLPDIVIADFGTAKLASDKDARVNPGTACFHAPEDRAVYGNAKPSRETWQLFFQMGQQRTTASDIYAFGLIIGMMANKSVNPRPIGANPADVWVSKEYGAPQIRDFIVRCLATDPAERAEASFREGLGILPLVGEIRKARDAMARSRTPLGPTEWAGPPPKPQPKKKAPFVVASLG